MRTSATLTFVVLLGAMALSKNAGASAEYVQYIPNGNVETCDNCHPGGNTTALNVFGQDAANESGKPSTQWWPDLVDLDSDGDGQTNGQEMGDPCGDWLIGLTPGRTTAISNPGDPASVSADPDNPNCDGGSGGGGGAGGAGGTSVSSGAGAGAATSGNGATTGAGAGNTIASSGAGKADPPLATPGSCATNLATPGAAWDIGLLAGTAMLLSRLRRRKRT